MRFDWRLAQGELELHLSWLSVSELEMVIVLHDGDIEREVEVTDAFYIFTETDFPEVFTNDFDGSFQMFHRVPYGPLKGTESFSIEATERMSKALKKAAEALRGCGAKDHYIPTRTKRAWREWDHSQPGRGKRARHGYRWQGWNGTEYPWRRCAKGDQDRPRKACLFHNPAVGKRRRNNRFE